MGGTAVGKKRFIEHCANRLTRPDFMPANLLPFWINDGPCEVDFASAALERGLLLRWQWGREEHIPHLRRDFPGIKHQIVLVTTSLINQMSRVALREGSLKWNADALAFEAVRISELVMQLACDYQLPVRIVDSSDGRYTLRRMIA